MDRYRRAALVKNAIERFLSSADDEPTLRHVPESDKEGKPLADDFRLRVRRASRLAQEGCILMVVTLIWNELTHYYYASFEAMTYA